MVHSLFANVSVRYVKDPGILADANLMKNQITIRTYVHKYEYTNLWYGLMGANQ